MDHLGFLLKVCELELIERERKAAARRLKAAALPALKLISEFDFTAEPTINRLLVLDLMRCDYINKRENVLLIGSSGTGKTHVATALAVEACSQGKRVATGQEISADFDQEGGAARHSRSKAEIGGGHSPFLGACRLRGVKWDSVYGVAEPDASGPARRSSFVSRM